MPMGLKSSPAPSHWTTLPVMHVGLWEAPTAFLSEIQAAADMQMQLQHPHLHRRVWWLMSYSWCWSKIYTDDWCVINKSTNCFYSGLFEQGELSSFPCGSPMHLISLCHWFPLWKEGILLHSSHGMFPKHTNAFCSFVLNTSSWILTISENNPFA